MGLGIFMICTSMPLLLLPTRTRIKVHMYVVKYLAIKASRWTGMEIAHNTALPVITIDGSPNWIHSWPLYFGQEKVINYCQAPAVIPEILPEARNPSSAWYSCTVQGFSSAYEIQLQRHLVTLQDYSSLRQTPMSKPLCSITVTHICVWEKTLSNDWRKFSYPYNQILTGEKCSCGRNDCTFVHYCLCAVHVPRLQRLRTVTNKY